MSDTSLTAMNTLGVPSKARRVHLIEKIDDLKRLAARFRANGPVVLGGGSNVVLAETIEQPVCLIRNRGIGVTRNGSAVEVTVAAGENWHNLVRWSLANGLAGLENLALIPGCVGAAPVQNIGAYGVELEGLFQRLLALDVQAGELLVLNRDDCKFAYRSSVFKLHPGRFIIAEVTLILQPGGTEVNTTYPDVAVELERLGVVRPDPVRVAEAVIRVRRRKLPDPRWVPNVGSFFKNPILSQERFDSMKIEHRALNGYSDPAGIKVAAAELIDLCGCKELRSGGLQVWPRQPLVLINPEHQSGAEVLAFAERIRVAVLQRFGVRLEIEPDIVGL
ncbi:MAG: UDP-N-acetylmuramate dehydrogenase [Pseudomonadales bacterium]